MVFGTRFKTKKERAREEEDQVQQRKIAWMLAEQERERVARKLEIAQILAERDRERVARELEAARWREEVAAKDVEIARQQQIQLAQEKEAERIKNLRNMRSKRLKSTKPENLRILRDKVRWRYQLDIDIWVQRGVRGPDRPLVKKMMEEADAILAEIVSMVKEWEESDESFNTEEWKLARQIKERILMDGKRSWADNPPWTEN